MERVKVATTCVWTLLWFPIKFQHCYLTMTLSSPPSPFPQCHFPKGEGFSWIGSRIVADKMYRSGLLSGRPIAQVSLLWVSITLGSTKEEHTATGSKRKDEKVYSDSNLNSTYFYFHLDIWQFTMFSTTIHTNRYMHNYGWILFLLHFF